MSGRKVFTAGEVLQAADVNDFLMDQSVMVFAGTAARGSAIPSPSEGMVTYRSDDDVVEVYTTDWDPVGVPPAILQVVQSTTTTPVSTNSLTYGDIGLSATITPSSATSKILVLTSVLVDARRASTQAGAKIKILRDAISIHEDLGDGSTFINAATASSFVIINARIAVQVLDAPASTSTLTYKVQGSVPNVAATAEYQRNNNTSFLTLMEVAA